MAYVESNLGSVKKWSRIRRNPRNFITHNVSCKKGRYICGGLHSKKHVISPINMSLRVAKVRVVFVPCANGRKTLMAVEIAVRTWDNFKTHFEAAHRIIKITRGVSISA